MASTIEMVNKKDLDALCAVIHSELTLIIASMSICSKVIDPNLSIAMGLTDAIDTWRNTLCQVRGALEDHWLPLIRERNKKNLTTQ